MAATSRTFVRPRVRKKRRRKTRKKRRPKRFMNEKVIPCRSLCRWCLRELSNSSKRSFGSQSWSTYCYIIYYRGSLCLWSNSRFNTFYADLSRSGYYCRRSGYCYRGAGYDCSRFGTMTESSRGLSRWSGNLWRSGSWCNFDHNYGTRAEYRPNLGHRAYGVGSSHGFLVMSCGYWCRDWSYWYYYPNTSR